MANRNPYTYTPAGYAGSGRGYVPPGSRNAPGDAARTPQPQTRQQPVYEHEQEAQPQPRRNMPQPQQPNYQMGELVMFALVLFAIPLIGIIGVFFRPFLWVFIILNAGCLALLWLKHLYAFTTRTVMSVILLGLAVVALIAAIDLTPKQVDYPSVGGAGTDLYASGQTGGFPSITDTTALTDGSPDWSALNNQGSDGTSDEGGGDLGGGSDPSPTSVPVLGGNPGTEATTPPANQTVVQAKEALEKYLNAWTTFDYDEMTRASLPSWRQLQDSAKTQLYMMHNWWQLNGWTITSETASPSADSVTFYVVTDMERVNNTQKDAVRQQYTALVIKYEGDGLWYVDPDSMRSGIAVTETPAPQQQDTGPTPEPTASPEPTVGPNTTLWYNSSGGKRYHIEERCSSIDAEYYSKMKSFPYSDLSKSTYSKLVACPTCDAPERE